VATSDRRIRLGTAYYPEQWPRERWPVDARLIAEAGLSLVRMGEFAWAELEPEPGRFDFDWLDEAIDLFAGHGLEIVLGTPTAAPPAWLVREHPDILPVPDRHPLGFGTRRHYCPNAPPFLEATDRIVAALAGHYGRDARVRVWQIDNEVGGRCYCEHCRTGFRRWLRDRYRTLEALNSAWGTAFWSQRYDTWEDVGLPAPDPIRDGGFSLRAPNPGLALDFRRFSSESYVGFLRRQQDLLRTLVEPEQRITHNLMGFDVGDVDYPALTAGLDFVSWDNYPAGSPTGSWTRTALSADAMRGLKPPHVWVMEQQVGPLGWEYVRSPRRGQMRLFAYQAIAHGAETLVFFRWRSARFGTEQHWYGVLDADGTVGRRYRELERLAGELRELAVLAEAEHDADIALLYDFDSRFALQIQPAHAALAHEASVHRWYAALRRLGLGVDVVPAGRDLSRYRLVVVPSMPIVEGRVAAALAAHVEAGGTLIVGPRTGVRDTSGAVPDGRMPAGLVELLGVEVTDIASGELSAGLHGTVTGTFDGWFEELAVVDAASLATYADGDFAGGAAVSERRVRDGTAVYVGGAGDDALLASLLRALCARAEIVVHDLPDDVEVVPLRAGDERFAVVLNHGDHELRVTLASGTTLAIPKFDIVVVRPETPAEQPAVAPPVVEPLR
jgi:beta-galactosidase